MSIHKISLNLIVNSFQNDTFPVSSLRFLIHGIKVLHSVGTVKWTWTWSSRTCTPSRRYSEDSSLLFSFFPLPSYTLWFLDVFSPSFFSSFLSRSYPLRSRRSTRRSRPVVLRLRDACPSRATPSHPLTLLGASSALWLSLSDLPFLPLFLSR